MKLTDNNTETRLGVKQAFLFAGILLLAMLFFHGPLMWGGQVLCGGDLVNQFIPMRESQVEHGWFSPWMEETFSGRPLAEEVQVAAFYPPNWLHLVVRPVERGFTFLTLAHLFFSGVGMYLFLRRRFSFAGAALGGLLWVCGGYLPIRLVSGVVVFIYAFAWLPWMWWAAERQSLARGGLRWTGLLALFGGMQVLAGSPQPVQITWIGLGAWTLGRMALPEKGEKRWAIAGGFVAAGLLAVVMAMPYLAGILRFQSEAYPRSTEDLFAYLADGSLMPRVVLTWIAPEFFGPGISEIYYWASNVGFHETNFYLGVVPLVLAAAFFAMYPWKRLREMPLDGEKRIDVRWLGTLFVLALFSLGVAVGEEFVLFELLTSFVPTFDLFRVPARWIVWCSLAVIVAAAWGLTLVQQRMEQPAERTSLIRWGIAAGGVIVFCVLLRLLAGPILEAAGLSAFARQRFGPAMRQQQAVLLDFATSAAAWAMAMALIAGLLGAMGLAGRLKMRAMMVLLFAVALIDLRIFWEPFAMPIPDNAKPVEIETESYFHRISAEHFRDYFYPETDVVRYLREQPNRGRVHYADALIVMQYDQYTRELANERPAFLDIDVTRGYQQLHLRSYVEDYRASLPAYQNRNAGDAFLLYAGADDGRFFEAYNVTHLLGFRKRTMEELHEKAGLGESTPVGSYGCIAWHMPRARGWAWLSPEESFLDAEPGAALGRIDVTERTPSRWSGTVEVESPCYLHLSTPDYKGWKLAATNAAGQAISGLNSRTVRLDKGTWEFVREFESVSLKPKYLLPAIAALLAAIGLVVGGRKRDGELP